MELKQILNEKMITFDGKAFPKNGHCVFFVGGPGVGKGYVRQNILLIDGKIMSADFYQELFAKKEGIELKFPQGGGEKEEYLLRKAGQSVSKQIQAFYKGVYDKIKSGKPLPNIIFDFTGRDYKITEYSINKVKEMGYRTTMVAVTADEETAIKRNLRRERTIPIEALKWFHKKVKENFPRYVDLVDNVWVVNTSEEGRFWENPFNVLKVK